MRPTVFNQANVNMQPPEAMEDCMPLPVFTDGTMYVSRWMPNREDLEALNRGEPLWLFLWGGQPPVSLETENPFAKTLIPNGEV